MPETTTLAGQIEEARRNGYSDEEITAYLGSQRKDLEPKIREAQGAGYSNAEIVGHLGGGSVPDVRSTITYAGEEKPAMDRFAGAVEPFVGKSVTRAGSAFWEGIGGKMLMDVQGLFEPDPERRRKAQEALSGFAEGIAAEPGRVWGELSQSGQSMLALNALDTVSHLAKSVPLFGGIAAQVEDDVKRGDYAGAVGHALASIAPFGGPRAVRAGKAAVRRGVAAGVRAAETTRAVVPGAVRGGWAGATEPVGVPLTVKGVRIPDTGVYLPRGVVYGAAGGYAGGPLGAAVGVGLATVPGAVKGGRAAYTDLLRNRVMRARMAADARKVPPGQLPPGPFVMEPPPDPSGVYTTTGQYAQPEPVPPGRQLPTPPRGPIITPAPEDVSGVRAVPAEYPPVLPTHLRGNPQAESAAWALWEEMQKEPPPPVSAETQAAARGMREAMGLPEEELRAPVGEEPAVVSGAIREARAREAQAAKLAQTAQQWNITSETVQTFEPEHWGMLAQSIAEELPANPEQMADLATSVLRHLRETERQGRQPPPPATPTPAAPPAPKRPPAAPPAATAMTPEAQTVAEGVREALEARPQDYQLPEAAAPAPPRRLTDPEKRIEALSKTVAALKIPSAEVEGFLGTEQGRFWLEKEAQRQKLRRPTKADIPQIVSRVAELRTETPLKPRRKPRVGPMAAEPEMPSTPPAVVPPVIPAETPISRPMVDPSLLSPSGRASGRAEAAAKQRAGREIFPEGMPAPAGPVQPTEAQAMRQKAAELRSLAERGMKPRAYLREAENLEAQAAAIEATIEPSARIAGEHPVFRTPEQVPEPVGPVTGVRADAETKIRIPGEEQQYTAHYAVRELEDVQASHNAVTFQQNPRYHHRNDREYSNPANQERIILNSQKGRFDPAYLLTDSPDAINGAPVVDANGNVLGGNSRRMILERVYGSNPEGAAAYKAELARRAQQFGIDPVAIEGMRRPILVRELVPGQEMPPQRLITELNKTGTAALTATERATADARMLSGEVADYLAGVIEAEGADATLNDVLTGKRGVQIVNKLVDDGVFTMQEKPQLVDARTGALTAAAKERISKMLLGQVFESSDQMMRTPLDIRNKVERIVSPLLQTGGKPGFELLPTVREAVDVLEYARVHGITNLEDAIRQESMFGGGPQFSPRAVALAEFIRDNKPTTVGQAFRRYVANAEPTMFGASTPAEAFADAFGGKKPRGVTLREFMTSEEGSFPSRRGLPPEEIPPARGTLEPTPVAEAREQFRQAKDAAKVEFAPAEPQGWNAILEQSQSKLNAEAQAAMERIRKRGNVTGTKLGSVFPLDFEDISDMAIWGASKIMNGTVNVAKWSKEMLADAGPEAAPRLKPLLTGIYQESQKVYERMLKSATEGLPSLQKTMEMYKTGKAGEDWYLKTRAELEEVFGKDTPIFLRFLAATSPNQTVAGNVTMALKAYHQWKAGEPFTGFLRTEHWDVADNLQKIVNGEEFGGVKQKSFEANIFGDPIPVTVDRWIYRAFGFPGTSPTPAQYKFIDYAISQAAKRKGIEPRQMQAAIWKTIKEELGKKGNTSEAVEVVLRKRLEADPILAAEIRKAAAAR